MLARGFQLAAQVFHLNCNPDCLMRGGCGESGGRSRRSGVESESRSADQDSGCNWADSWVRWAWCSGKRVAGQTARSAEAAGFGSRSEGRRGMPEGAPSYATWASVDCEAGQ